MKLERKTRKGERPEDGESRPTGRPEKKGRDRKVALNSLEITDDGGLTGFVVEGTAEAEPTAPTTPTSAVDKLVAKVPTWEGASLPAAKDLEADLNKLVGASEGLGESVANAVTFIRDAHRLLVEVSQGDQRKAQMAQEQVRGNLAQAKKFLAETVNQPASGIRTSAVVAYLRTAFTLDYRHTAETDAMLEQLCEDGVLTTNLSNDRDAVRFAFGRWHYELCRSFGFLADDIRNLQADALTFNATIRRLQGEERRKAKEQMSAEAEISLDEAWNGACGKCLVHIPPESYPDNKTGEIRWRKGGDVLFVFGEKKVQPLSATGSLEELVGELVGARAATTRQSLAWTEAPQFFPIARRLKDSGQAADMRTAQDMARNLVTVWRLLQRAKCHADAMELHIRELEEMSAQAEISVVQFFGLNGSKEPVTGKTALLQLTGVFRTNTGNFYNPFLLARLEVDNGEQLLEVVGLPTCLQERFGKHTGTRIPMSDRRADPELFGLIGQIRKQTHVAARGKAVIETDVPADEESAGEAEPAETPEV